ncbi:MAG TPA: hypothetical protein VFJ02_03440 [Vicinamibacterales bacterium]|nr:hypothetical protein [Vicinamibacterales bacterium]
MFFSRRRFLSLPPLALLAHGADAYGQAAAGGSTATDAVRPSFPAHDPELAREMVTVAHGNVTRVRELLGGRPALANAAWDWGFGDWESALGAAAHVGNREIAGLLIDAGARPTIFSAAMLGQLDAVRALIAAAPGVQRIRGPHGISLLAHARAGGPGAAPVAQYLESIGDADPRYRNETLTDGDRSAIAGTYAFGTDASARFTVAVGDRGPTIQRQGSAARNLFHLGGRVFHPSGADAVRIRFAVGERAAALVVEDGPLTVTAARMPGV